MKNGHLQIEATRSTARTCLKTASNKSIRQQLLQPIAKLFSGEQKLLLWLRASHKTPYGLFKQAHKDDFEVRFQRAKPVEITHPKWGRKSANSTTQSLIFETLPRVHAISLALKRSS